MKESDTVKKSRKLIGATTLAIFAWGAAAHAADKPIIALIQNNMQALFFVQLGQGAQAEADKKGYKLVIFDANNDPAAQNNAMETYTQQKVSGIIVDALDRFGIMTDIKSATRAGIPVVAVDTIVPQGPQVAQVGVDSEEAGRSMGEFFLKYMNAHGGKETVGIVGALESSDQNLREKGFVDVVKSAPGVTMAGVVDGRNVQEDALAAAENLITANPSLTAIYATGEPALIGAAAAVETQGKQNQVRIFGWDLSKAAIRGIDSGYVVGVVQQNPTAMGAVSVDAIVAKLADKAPAKTVTILVPIDIVTKATVGPYRPIFK
jgi:ribose transport system substrate-binding protein